jgi:hypothetical protein
VTLALVIGQKPIFISSLCLQRITFFQFDICRVDMTLHG